MVHSAPATTKWADIQWRRCAKCGAVVKNDPPPMDKLIWVNEEDFPVESYGGTATRMVCWYCAR